MEPLHVDDDDNKGSNVDDVVYSLASLRVEPLPRRPDDNYGQYVRERGESLTSGCPDSTSRCPNDNNGHYVPELGKYLDSRYQIMSKLGKGTFGTVLECLDSEVEEIVAIKVVRNGQKYQKDALHEIRVLPTLAGKEGFLQYKRWFNYQNHMCIVCEKLGPSLYDLRRKNNDRTFPLDLVQDISRQLLKAVAYMHHHKLTHTDIKLENILLVSSADIKIPDKNSSNQGRHYMELVSSAIKLIDFGNATYENEGHRSLFSTVFNCAPEVILGLGWSYPCDLWSVGCILVELYWGHALFQADDNLERLARMQKVLGPIPRCMIVSASTCKDRFRKWLKSALSRGSIQEVEISTSTESRQGRALSKAAENLEKLASKRSSMYFQRGTVLKTLSNIESINEVEKLPSLQELIKQNVDHSAGALYGALIDLLGSLLTFDPDKRISAKKALKHEFFRERT